MNNILSSVSSQGYFISDSEANIIGFSFIGGIVLIIILVVVISNLIARNLQKNKTIKILHDSILDKIDNQNKISKNKKDDNVPFDYSKYNLKQSTLTENELKFYNILRSYLGDKILICPKVGIKDFISYPDPKKDNPTHFNKITQKHVDFLLCDPLTLMPICAVELDDSSHKLEERKKRDEFVDLLCKEVGLRIIHYVLDDPNIYSFENINDKFNEILDLNCNSFISTPVCSKCGIYMRYLPSTYRYNEFFGCYNYKTDENGCNEIVHI